jgi:hypothetical protein
MPEGGQVLKTRSSADGADHFRQRRGRPLRALAGGGQHRRADQVVREGTLRASDSALRGWFRSCRWPGRHPAIIRCRRVVSVWITKRKRRRSLDDRSSLSSRISAAARIAASRFNTSCSDDSPGRTCSDSWVACSQRTANRVMGRGVELCLAQVSAARCTLRTTRPGHGAIQRPNILCCKCENNLKESGHTAPSDSFQRVRSTTIPSVAQRNRETGNHSALYAPRTASDGERQLSGHGQRGCSTSQPSRAVAGFILVLMEMADRASERNRLIV